MISWWRRKLLIGQLSIQDEPSHLQTPIPELSGDNVPDEAVTKCTGCGIDFSAFVRKQELERSWKVSACFQYTCKVLIELAARSDLKLIALAFRGKSPFIMNSQRWASWSGSTRPFLIRQIVSAMYLVLRLCILKWYS
ncbi:hypothetical protein PHJA_000039700 [Phtheirospermum japonicum]|uniref:Uncharacterized protein n=1 Tax=Phtheirospermum japonicum TaxID=374723 RepID=A0A830B0T4_9LAMI|nr:hypothetical protein PHJA_000039700 [Phtheirospermum japonicum]